MCAVLESISNHAPQVQTHLFLTDLPKELLDIVRCMTKLWFKLMLVTLVSNHSPVIIQCFLSNHSAFSTSAWGRLCVPGLNNSSSSTFKCWHAFELHSQFVSTSLFPSCLPFLSTMALHTFGFTVSILLFNHSALLCSTVSSTPWWRLL